MTALWIFSERLRLYVMGRNDFTQSVKLRRNAKRRQAAASKSLSEFAEQVYQVVGVLFFNGKNVLHQATRRWIVIS